MNTEVEENVLEIENNQVFLKGVLEKELEFSHESFNEKFYKTSMKVLRLSGDLDYLNIIISERELAGKNNFKKGDIVSVDGEVRSYNYYEEDTGRRRLLLNVFVKNINNISKEDLKDQSQSNKVILKGFICKQPTYRKTPFGREIADLLVAVNRLYGKSDYIPCIAWGRTARFSENFEIGTEVNIEGRIQSRTYKKKTDDGNEEERTAYEVSVVSLDVAEDSEEKVKNN